MRRKNHPMGALTLQNLPKALSKPSQNQPQALPKWIQKRSWKKTSFLEVIFYRFSWILGIKIQWFLDVFLPIVQIGRHAFRLRHNGSKRMSPLYKPMKIWWKFRVRKRPPERNAKTWFWSDFGLPKPFQNHSKIDKKSIENPMCVQEAKKTWKSAQNEPNKAPNRGGAQRARSSAGLKMNRAGATYARLLIYYWGLS